MEQTKEIAADLLDKKGRLTVEELLGAVSRAYGIDQLTDTQREARGLVSNRAEINSIDEAYAVAEQGVEDLIKRLDLKESAIDQDVAGLELEKKTAR